ncbi:MAG: glycosyltransferase family 87 protein [Chloroflexia bacterium]
MIRSRSGSRWRIYGTVSLLACALGYIAALGMELWHQGHTWSTSHRELDFPSYYLAGQLLLQGKDVYSGLRSEARLQLGLDGYFIDSAVGPPAFVVSIAWLALLPYPAAWCLWQVLSLIAWIGSLWLIARELRPSLSLWGRIALGCAFVLFPPLAFHLVYAHTELFLLLGLTLSWLWLRRGKWLPAGLLLGLAAVTRLYPALFFLLLAQRRAWKALATSMGSALGMSLVAAALCGPTAYLRYVSVQHRVVPELYSRQGNLSLWGSVYKLASIWPALSRFPQVRDLLACLLSAAAVVLVFLLVQRHQAPHAADSEGPFSLDRGFALYIAACLLASPLAWAYYQVLLYLPFLILVSRLKAQQCAACFWALAVAGAASLSPLLALLCPQPPAAVRWVLAFLPTLTPAGTLLALAWMPKGAGAPVQASGQPSAIPSVG